MGKIIAKGIHAGLPVTVTCENEGAEIFLKFNDKTNKLYEGYFFDRMDECHPMGGTYIPDKRSMLNAFNVCEYHFFDERPEITVEGDIGEMPNESDVVY